MSTFELIRTETANFSVKRMCRLLLRDLTGISLMISPFGFTSISRDGPFWAIRTLPPGSLSCK